ncbi:ParA family protein [bacterium]|nr:MAG: ParA family protein [bacterium]
MKKICFLSLKGGTGKTTTAFNVATQLANQGLKVLAIDLDPQGYLTCSFGESTAAGRKNVHDVINGVPIKEAIRETKSGVHLIAADLELTTADLDMKNEGREFFMRKALEKVTGYDVVVFDCCPFMGILSVNALVASDELIIPTEPEFLAMRGVRQLYLKVVQIIQKDLNPDLEFSGVVVTKFDSRKRNHRETSEKIAKLFPDKVFETKIRTNVALANATAAGVSIFDFAPDSNGATDYKALTDEVVKRYGLEKKV